jgi:Bacterial membrane protein YfhO
MRMSKNNNGEVATVHGPAAPDEFAPAWARWFVASVFVGTGLLALWAMGQMASREASVAEISLQGWGTYAGVIVDNKIRALWHAACMAMCAGGAAWFFLLKGNAKSALKSLLSGSLVAWILILLVAGDAWVLSGHYVKTMPMSAVAENPVISLLKCDVPERRVALISQEGFYNSWLTYLFPYHGINAVNITQMPRMPEDYKKWLSAVGRNPVRMWQLSAVGYVLAPAKIWTQIQNDPAYSYNVGPAEVGVSVLPASLQYPAQHVVLRLKFPAPRFALIGGYQEVSDDEALRLLASPGYPLFEKVLVARTSTPCSFKALGVDGEGIVGKCKLMRYRPGRMELDVESLKPAVLRVSEKYDQDWTASVDGQAIEVRRIDYIALGIYVPQGMHHVLLRYEPPFRHLYLQGMGLLFCIGAFGSLLVYRRSNPQSVDSCKSSKFS